MDLVDYSEEAFDAVVRDFCAFGAQLAVRDTAFVPISALRGDNVVERSEAMPWYGGPAAARAPRDGRDRRRSQPRRAALPGAVRHPRRRRATTAATRARSPAASLRPGDEVARAARPSGVTTVASIDTYDGPARRGLPAHERHACVWPTSSTSRAATSSAAPTTARPWPATSWPTSAGWPTRPLRPGGRYAIKHATHTARAIVDELDGPRRRRARLRREPGPAELALNDIGRVRLRTSKPLAFDPYARNRATGSFILIDEATNDTVGAGMITVAVPPRAR